MTGPEAIRAGEAAEQGGDLVLATAAYQSALDHPDHTIAADAHFHLGRVAWRQGRYDDALAAYTKARALALESDSMEVRARVENGIGAVHYARGEYAQARAAYGVALELTHERSMRAKIVMNLGVIANIEGDLEDAREHYQNSRALFREAHDLDGEALTLHNIGMLHADLEEWEEADEAYERCLELCESRGNRQMIANVLLNRSELSCARDRYGDAVAGCDLALSIYSAIGDEVGRGEAMRWKGHALRLMGQLDQAERALNDAARIAHRTQVKLLEAEAMRDLGALYRARADVAQATKSLERALELFTQLGAQREVDELGAELRALSSGAGD
jgi:tetratricopeptide (TPR) repeat protein